MFRLFREHCPSKQHRFVDTWARGKSHLPKRSYLQAYPVLLGRLAETGQLRCPRAILAENSETSARSIQACEIIKIWRESDVMMPTMLDACPKLVRQV